LLTGQEADADALTEAVSLDTHTRDVQVLLAREDLYNVVLVGHSYAGMIFDQFTGRARREASEYHERLTGHDCHVELP